MSWAVDTNLFIDYVNKKGDFSVKIAKEINDGHLKILELRHLDK
jgi:hypothetical protein